MARPDLSSTPPFFHNYIQQVTGDDLAAAFKKDTSAFTRFIESIPAGKQDYRYAAGKWTIRELLQHIIDAERIFAYRALRFARKDKTPLQGFDENSYAETSKADRRDWQELVDEFKTVRKSSEYLFGSFDEDQLHATGTSSGNSIVVLALGYIIIGHSLHHKKVIEERYL
jgi:uncharacterized damage-inducible protein DinB